MRRTYERHYEESAVVVAAPPEAFAVIDDHTALSGHMSKPSWRTLWSSMRLTMDGDAGRRVGSHIGMESRMLGLRLHLDEVVTEREPPRSKEWETAGTPRLLVVGHYRMRADIEPEGAGSRVRVRIDYRLPERGAWLGRLLGEAYARWCVSQMLRSLTTPARRPLAA